MYQPTLIDNSWNLQILWLQLWGYMCFLYISKAFNKVWHDGVMFKLEQKGVSGNIRDILQEILEKAKSNVKRVSLFLD